MAKRKTPIKTKKKSTTNSKAKNTARLKTITKVAKQIRAARGTKTVTKKVPKMSWQAALKAAARQLKD